MLKNAMFMPGFFPDRQKENIDWIHTIGMLASALTLMHLGAFFLWLWLLARSGTLPASAQQQLQNFKKFSIKYDFDVDVSRRGPSVGAQLGALGPAKRNRSSQRLETMEP